MNTEMRTVGRMLDEHRKLPDEWRKYPAVRGIDGDTARTSKLLEEIGEVQMALTEGGLPEELADCFIILLDLAYCNDVDLDKAIEDKLQALREKWGNSSKQLELFERAE